VSDVLIRDVPSDDLELIRSAAADRGVSLQSYLRSAVQAQATYLRRQDALRRLGQRLQGGEPVPEPERAAVLDAMESEHTKRSREIDEHA
jgi:hypothetical protein